MKYSRNIKYVNVKEVINLNKYEYNLTSNNLDLVSSIKKEGILIPIWLCENKGYEIIDGHQRVKAAKLSNSVQIPANIFPHRCQEELFISSIYVNKFTRKMSVTEKLLAIHLATRYYSAETAEKVIYILGIPQIFNLHDITKKIVNLPRWLKDYFHRKDFHLKMLGKLMRYSIMEYRCWFEMASSLNLKGAEFALLLDQIRDMTIRDGVKPSQLWIDLGIDDVMKLDITNHQRVQKIKMKVEAFRYPTLQNIQRKLRQEIKRLEKEFSFRLDINWDDKLEQPGIMMNFQLSDDAEVKEFIKRIGKDKFKNKLTFLFDLMNQIPERSI